MPFNGGFQKTYSKPLKHAHFPVKVSFNGFAILFKILSAHCDLHCILLILATENVVRFRRNISFQSRNLLFQSDQVENQATWRLQIFTWWLGLYSNSYYCQFGMASFHNQVHFVYYTILFYFPVSYLISNINILIKYNLFDSAWKFPKLSSQL